MAYTPYDPEWTSRFIDDDGNHSRDTASQVVPVAPEASDTGIMDIDTLLREKRRVTHRKNQIYMKVLNLCHRRIRYHSKKCPEITWCAFKIPPFIPGLPRFNINSCTRYCLAKLRQNGFETTLVPPHTIIISWKVQEQRSKRRAQGMRIRSTNRVRCGLRSGQAEANLVARRRRQRKRLAYFNAPPPRYTDRIPPERPSDRQ